jgi:hypothetical protein
MTKQWILTRITKDGKAFIVGNPNESLTVVQLGSKQAKQAYPNQRIVVRDLEAFKQTPVPKKYL